MNDTLGELLAIAVFGAIIVGVLALAYSVGRDRPRPELVARVCTAELKLVATEADSLRYVIAHRECEQYAKTSVPVTPIRPDEPPQV